MTDLFEEVEEQLRSDRYRALARKAAPWIVALAALALVIALGVWGWRQYNQQVTDSLTDTFLSAAKRAGIPVVGVYETMPRPGYDYQSWMLAETRALQRAVAAKVSTEKLT